jgi:predicted metalloprotease with PDZ domain
MRSVVTVLVLCAVLASGSYAAQSAGPSLVAPIAPIAPPKDQAYPGEIQLSVDATDPIRRIVRVHESISGITAETVLLYPKWLPGTHSPEGTIERVAGLRVTAQGANVNWTRDPVDVYAFRIHAGAGVKTIEVDFDYLSPPNTTVGDIEISRDLLFIEWNSVVLYPAGYFVRQIPVVATLKVPAGWQSATALESATGGGAQATYKRVSLETLIDSPVYAGRYAKRLELDPGSPAPVYLNLFADHPESLEVKPEQLEAHRALVSQAYKLFGSRHYAHYDFLYSLSDQVFQEGLEHHQSSENGTDPETFTDWDKTAWERDLLAHEYTHSWNGKFRRPADLWVPSYNVPMQNSLLWVYEGQTQYWGDVLAGRAGLRTRQQTLDQFALTAAYYEIQSGRHWRSLQDTTNDAIIDPGRRPLGWSNWQRFEDYYSEAELLWLDADTLIRERSQGKRSLDDFAHAFFGVNDGSVTTLTYTFADVVKALNAVEPYDWSAFLRERLDSIGKPPPLDGLRRGGYKLVYTDTPSDYQHSKEGQSKHTDLLYSIGIELNDKDEPGTVSEVVWDGPAFKANMTEGMRIIAINGVAYDADVLKDAVAAAKNPGTPIELIVKHGERYLVVHIDYREGLRYPHLERDPSVPARLDDILSAR